ncbi:MAG TPA: hypothetical protein DCG34_11555 [Clostridiales bacterium]|nr:hypothetical protein [Clostridiales bacterium]
MKIRLFSDENGVSPVIGVMLMIVVTVILAAAVSSFASTTSTQEAAPQATFTADVSLAEGNITLVHLGGDTLLRNSVRAEITYGTMSTSLGSDAFRFEPMSSYLRPGDTAYVEFVGNSTTGSALFNDIVVNRNTPFRFTLIDTISGQTVYSTNLIMNP